MHIVYMSYSKTLMICHAQLYIYRSSTDAGSPMNVQSLFSAVEIGVNALGCDTLMVNYTVNPLPGGGNEATLRSLEVSYRPPLAPGISGSRSVALNGSTIEGVLCLSSLTISAPYHVTYSVEVNTGFSVVLPSDISAPARLLTFTGRTCGPQQCTEIIRTRTITITPSTCPTSGKDGCSHKN